MTEAPPKEKIRVFVNLTSLRVNNVTTTLGEVPHELLSKRCIYYANMVTIVPPKVSYIIMVFQMLKNYSVVTIFFRMIEC